MISFGRNVEAAFPADLAPVPGTGQDLAGELLLRPTVHSRPGFTSGVHARLLNKVDAHDQGRRAREG